MRWMSYAVVCSRRNYSLEMVFILFSKWCVVTHTWTANGDRELEQHTIALTSNLDLIRTWMDKCSFCDAIDFSDIYSNLLLSHFSTCFIFCIFFFLFHRLPCTHCNKITHQNPNARFSWAIWMSSFHPTFSMRPIQMEVAWMKVSRMKADKFN